MKEGPPLNTVALRHSGNNSTEVSRPLPSLSQGGQSQMSRSNIRTTVAAALVVALVIALFSLAFAATRSDGSVQTPAISVGFRDHVVTTTTIQAVQARSAVRPQVHKPKHPKRPPIDLGWMDVTRAPDWPFWACAMKYESATRAHPNGNWAHVARRGAFRGAFSIATTTWQAMANTRNSIGRRATAVSRFLVQRYPYANEAPPFVQVAVARDLLSIVGASRWEGLARCL